MRMHECLERRASGINCDLLAFFDPANHINLPYTFRAASGQWAIDSRGCIFCRLVIRVQLAAEFLVFNHTLLHLNQNA
jgi:hypothetical protein